MLEVLQFIFSSFWIWLGFLLIISVARGKSSIHINNKK